MNAIGDQELHATNIAWFNKYDFFIQEIRLRGYDPIPQHHLQNLIGSKYEVVYVEAIIAVLDRLPSLDEKYTFVNMLAGTTTPYDPMKVISIYNQLEKPWWKDTVLGTLAQSNPIGITEWFIERLVDRSDPFTQDSMAAYLGFSREYNNCREIMIEHYAEFPMGALNSFSNAGGEKELAFLLNFNHESVVIDDPEKMANYRKHLPKAIKKLENRVKRQGKK